MRVAVALVRRAVGADREAVGHTPQESADTYTHVMVDETEREYGAILART